MAELSSTFERLSMHHDPTVSRDASTASPLSASVSASASSSSNNNRPPTTSALSSGSIASRLSTSASTADHLSIPDMRKQRSQRFTVPTSHSESSLAQPPPSPLSSLSTSNSLAFQPAPAPVQAQSIPLSYHSLAEMNGPSAPPVQRSISEDSFTHGLPYTDHRYQSNGAGVPSSSNQQYNSIPSYHQPQPYLGAHNPNLVPHHLDYSSMNGNGGGGAGAGAPRFYAGGQKHDIGAFGGSRPDAPLDWLVRPPQQQQHQQLAPPGMGFDAPGSSYAALMGRAPPEDEVIPTAIVIKNIPFQVPKEQLLGVMEDLRLPAPFAFNYHFDNGQFRGLAFANFRSAADAALCVSALNGFDLQGRKLRTEFKKVLKEGEKEKIEREKALKRMRSARELNGGNAMEGPPPGWARREASAPGGAYGSVAPLNTDDDDYGRPVQGPYSSAFGGLPAPRSFGTREYVPAPPPPPPTGNDAVWGGFSGPQTTSSGSIAAPSSGPYSASPPSDVGTSISARMAHTTSSSGSESGGGRSGSSSAIELDMNDSQTLDIYSRVVVFKDDFLREELAFARSLSATQRRIVHLVARKLELGHRSVGVGDDRHVVVYKASATESQGPRGMSSTRSLRHSASTLARQSSRDTLNSYLHSNPSSAAHYSHPINSGGAMGSFMKPSPASHQLHVKKSMPDIRHSSNSRRSNVNLREGYQSLNAPRSTRSYQGVQNIFTGHGGAAPPVPPMPKEYYDSGSSSSPNLGGGGDPSPTSEEGGSTSTGATSSIGLGASVQDDVFGPAGGGGAWRRTANGLGHD